MNILSSENRGAQSEPAAWSRDRDPGGQDVRRLTRAASFIQNNLTSHDLTPEAVARAANVSRSTLYRLFKTRGGVSHYVQEQRLSLASRLLENPAEHRQISELAFDLGFISEAHFSRAFRHAFGAPPGTFRPSGRSPRALLF